VNLRALQARLRKLEKRSGLNNASDVFGKLSDAEVEAAVAVFDLPFDEPEAHQEAVDVIMQMLGCKESVAAAFVKFLGNITVDDAGFHHLSDEELIQLIVETEMRIEDLREGMG
jgi:hypothetical protein